MQQAISLLLQESAVTDEKRSLRFLLTTPELAVDESLRVLDAMEEEDILREADISIPKSK